MKTIICAVVICVVVFCIGCKKGSNENKAENSLPVSSNAFLPVSPTAGQQDVIARIKQDPDVRAYVLKVQEVFGKAYLIKDTTARNQLIKTQLTPYLEKISSKWSAYLSGRPDRNAIITAGIEGAFPPQPSPSAAGGPCEAQRSQAEGRCNRTMAVEAGLCALSWAGGPAVFGSCLVVVGAKSFLCLVESDIAYKNCISTRANIVKEGNRLLDWVYYKERGWTYAPITKGRTFQYPFKK